jgi:hypothetical protein
MCVLCGLDMERAQARRAIGGNHCAHDESVRAAHETKGQAMTPEKDAVLAEIPHGYTLYRLVRSDEDAHGHPTDGPAWDACLVGEPVHSGNERPVLHGNGPTPLAAVRDAAGKANK